MTETIMRLFAILDHGAAGGVTEVCVFQGGEVPTHAGYFDNHEAAAKTIRGLDGKGNLFVTVNPVKRDLLARGNNHLIEGSFKRKLKRTKDVETLCESWFFLDIDAERPSGISSTDAELHAAIEAGVAVRDWLIAAGVPASAILTATSGNGAYVLVRLPNYETTPARAAIKAALLKHLANLFNTPSIKIDQSVKNDARLICALGTMKVKGESIPERPHRRSSIGTVGGEKFDPTKAQRCEPIDLYELAEKILSKEEPAPKPTARSHAATFNGHAAFDIREYLAVLGDGKEARGFSYHTCPGCHGVEKLHVNQTTGAYGCFHIGAGTCSYDAIRAALGRPKGAPNQATRTNTPNAETTGASEPDGWWGGAPAQEAVANKAKPAKARAPLAKSWAIFDSEEYKHGERIAFAVERGEIALMNALPNAGKTTVALNASVSLAAGREFAPLVIGRTPRRVLYVDGETRCARLQRDLRTMTVGFSREEAIAVGENLHVICEAEINEELLTLTKTEHLLYLSQEAIRIKPDLIVMDTMASLCTVFNENDNAEAGRKIWRPFLKLARDCDAAVLVLHHVGKRNEDGHTPDGMYRGRGASAAGGAARAVWLLTPDVLARGSSILSCVKVKGAPPDDVRLALDFSARWMLPQVVAPAPPPLTPLERVLKFVTCETKASEIFAALKKDFSKRTVEEALSQAIEARKLCQFKRGTYAPAGDSADSADSAKPPLAESAESAENGPEAIEPAENEFPQFPQPPIGTAETAETTSSSKSNGLGEERKNSKKPPLRKPWNARSVSREPQIPQSPMVIAESAEVAREVFDV